MSKLYQRYLYHLLMSRFAGADCVWVCIDYPRADRGEEARRQNLKAKRTFIWLVAGKNMETEKKL